VTRWLDRRGEKSHETGSWLVLDRASGEVAGRVVGASFPCGTCSRSDTSGRNYPVLQGMGPQVEQAAWPGAAARSLRPPVDDGCQPIAVVASRLARADHRGSRARVRSAEKSAKPLFEGDFFLSRNPYA
jgi:hypothetical protein